MKEHIKDSNELLANLENLHQSDIAHSLKKIYKKSHEEFYVILKQLPDELLGEVILELPDYLREDIYATLSTQQLTTAVEELDSDDQTDFLQEVEEIDKHKAKAIFDGLEEEDQEEINWLKRYSDDVAGAYMQTELFSVKIDDKIGDSIIRLKHLKEQKEIENIHQVFVVDNDKKLLASISLEDLIIFDFEKTYHDILKIDENKFKAFKVQDDEDIDTVAQFFEKYDLNVAAVVGYQGMLIGRITSDDIIDVIEQNATEQMYQLAGVNEEFERDDNTLSVAKKRGLWLFINLGTAILASLVIGLFDQTIQKYVALAILMPIVASMGGNAGTQTLAVMVRKMALGEIDLENSKDAVKKEVLISIFNGMFFALIIGVIASFWFHTYMLGIVIGLSMIINLFSAGFFGASIPLMLKRFKIDPAVGSTVLLTTVTDIVGFFSFLGLAKLMLA
jgi:magnesium transporter